MLSLLFGSPVFSGPPDHAKGGGAEMSSTAHSNHAHGKAKAELHANGNAAFMGYSSEGNDTGDDTGDGNTDPATCSADTPEACDGASCSANGGFWGFEGPNICTFVP